MISILTILTQSLATGYFTYFLLNKMDLLVLSIKKKDEKIAVVSSYQRSICGYFQALTNLFTMYGCLF
ncbi:hypothetical protein CIRMBP1307_00352 [Enterococcus cecorum]|uniref:hypothetical protein n=1 Tax=Enterococcus cecorum TaxID=44008 RepID=UPI000A5AEC17|nr:hypothetical protein [Enterococcus cecorum]CAI3338890.1 hypothetical protein CIRMBP1307_00352 [Enterococcus cecorum]